MGMTAPRACGQPPSPSESAVNAVAGDRACEPLERVVDGEVRAVGAGDEHDMPRCLIVPDVQRHSVAMGRGGNLVVLRPGVGGIGSAEAVVGAGHADGRRTWRRRRTVSLRSADGHLVVLDLPLVLPHRWTPTLERLVRDSRRRRIGGRLVIFDEGFVVVPRRSAHRLPSELGTSSVADLAVQLPQNKAFSATDVDHAAATPAAFFPTRKAYIGLHDGTSLILKARNESPVFEVLAELLGDRFVDYQRDLASIDAPANTQSEMGIDEPDDA